MKADEDVERLVARLGPAGACDACIAERLPDHDRESVARSTTRLAGSAGFVRSRASCSLCGGEKLVIGRR
jgi:hypothetical protein